MKSIATIVLLLCAQLASAQCPGGVCPLPSRFVSLKPMVPVPEFAWHSGNGEYYLYLGGVQVGGYNLTEGYYRAYDAKTDRWSPDTQENPPFPLPVNVGHVGDARKNYGMLWQGSPDSRYTHNGKEISKATATALVGGSLTDDSSKLWVTAIGDDAARGKAVEALKTLPADLASSFAVKSYAPTRWEVKDSGFVTTGSPTIYAQAPTGKVLHRQDDMSDGSDGLFTAAPQGEGELRLG